MQYPAGLQAIQDSEDFHNKILLLRMVVYYYAQESGLEGNRPPGQNIFMALYLTF